MASPAAARTDQAPTSGGEKCRGVEANYLARANVVSVESHNGIAAQQAVPKHAAHQPKRDFRL